MIRRIHQRSRTLPTPMAGLALGVASFGWGMENALPLNGWGQIIGAVIACALLAGLVVRYTFHFDTLKNDLAHPVLGSIVPTFAMCLMVISNALTHLSLTTGAVLWGIAVIIHLFALSTFIYHRLKDPKLDLMVPSWFVPPVGIIVADVSFPGIPRLLPIAQVLFMIGLISYAILLPVMLYRLIFCSEVPNQAKPTIAILAAPASLSLAGYLTITPNPNLFLCAVLLGIAILMTFAVYFAFLRLLRLQFSPGYAAFTFPMAIGATALYKTANLVSTFPNAETYVNQIRTLAHFELAIAFIVITYVLSLYLKNLKNF